MKLALPLIRRDGGTQSRAELHAPAIDSYAEAMARGDAFPALDVYYDGQDYWLADGFHRWEAASLNGWADIEVDVYQGTRRDAVLHSLRANKRHGVQLTNADKRIRVRRLLEDPEWARWADTKIAEEVGVGRHFVARVRADLAKKSPHLDPDPGEPRRYVTKHGTEAVMNTAGITASNAARTRATEPSPPPPPVSSVAPLPGAAPLMVRLGEGQDAFERGISILAEVARMPDGAELVASVVDQHWGRLARLRREHAA